MHSFHNILYASTGIGDDIEGLKQALSLARNCRVALKFLLVIPDLPKSHDLYREKYQLFMAEQVEKAIHEARLALNMKEADTPVKVELESGDVPPAIGLIRHVLRHGHDLLIKETETKEEGTGFTSMDMTLLRKCPCPVWLARPIAHSRNKIRIAVAVSPENREKAEYDLSIRLLGLSRSLADYCSGELDILSCWDFEFEKYLRGNTRVDVPESTMRSTIDNAQSSHHAELSRLIEASGIGGTFHVHRLKGRAAKMISFFVKNKKVDILVMGTVARTGILGYLMGNTAENIMVELKCSLLALKPGGFVSPVKAY